MKNRRACFSSLKRGMAASLAMVLMSVPVVAQVAPPPANVVHRVSPVGKLKDLMPQLKAGDTVVFAAGTYQDCAAWVQNGLTLMAETPAAAVFDGVMCQGKAIFVTVGENITVDGIVFRNAKVVDQNGAGIRAEGRGLKVKRSQFIGNENGILSRSGIGGTLTISDSFFANNGKCAPVCAHGIYISDVDLLRVTRSRFVNTRDGHHIKSRARRTELYGNTIDDGATGTSSYLVEIPNGGNLVMQNNSLIKGPLSSNRSSFVAFGMEGLSNSSTMLQIIGNSFTNDMSRSTHLLLMKPGPTPQLRSNSHQGSITGAILVR
jgi:hypothetical protein